MTQCEWVVAVGQWMFTVVASHMIAAAVARLVGRCLLARPGASPRRAAPHPSRTTAVCTADPRRLRPGSPLARSHTVSVVVVMFDLTASQDVVNCTGNSYSSMASRLIPTAKTFAEVHSDCNQRNQLAADGLHAGDRTLPTVCHYVTCKIVLQKFVILKIQMTSSSTASQVIIMADDRKFVNRLFVFLYYIYIHGGPKSSHLLRIINKSY